jgi:dihydroorotate dehydrogenase
MVNRLKAMEKSDLIIGANIGKNKDTPNEKAVDDYLICFNKLFQYVDYFVVNVSSPNTPGLRELQEKEPLTHLLNQLQEANKGQVNPKPVLLKIAPDLTPSQLEDVIEVVNDTKLDGLILTNTTISREGLVTATPKVEKIGAGGLSGKPLAARAGEMLAAAHGLAKGRFPIISVGGIMRPEDAHERLKAGAVLVQVYTGFVYEGPAFAKRICRFLSNGC